MATASSSIVLNTPTNNASVTSLKPISDLLQAMVTAGKLTQTADTGQVSWAGVAANQISTNNYEIFYLNDSLHGTYPLYLRFVYATQTTGNVPKCSVQIGTGTDGAGNLTGMVSAARFFRGQGTATATDTNSQTIWASCGSGYLNIWGGFSPTSLTSSVGGFGLSIERLRDNSGAITGDGVTVNISDTGSTSTTPTMYPASAGGVVPTAVTLPVSNFMVGNWSAQRSQIPGLFNTSNWVAPQIMSRGGIYYSNPHFDGTNFVATACQPYAGKIYSPGIAYVIADTNFPATSAITMSIYSTSHTYFTANLNMAAIVTAGMSSAPGIAGFSASALTAGVALPCFLYE